MRIGGLAVGGLTLADLLATAYQAMGINPHTFVKDMADRPVPLPPSTCRPIAELV